MSIPGAASPLFIGAAAAEAAAYQIDRSLRFNKGDSAFLDKTFSSASNRRTWTFSAWLKRSLFGASQRILRAVSGSTEAGIQFLSGEKIELYDYSGGYTWQLNTSALFRDPSAWYHIVVAFDTTQATAADRVSLYVNGSKVTDFSTSTYPSQNFEGLVNNNVQHALAGQDILKFGGYMAEVHFVDGQALAASDFGEYDDNNVWQPIEYSGTYGTNGFYLDFSDNSSNAALGTDSSGNSNTWTVNNISAAAGTDYLGTGTYTASEWDTTNKIDHIFDGNDGTLAYRPNSAGAGTSTFTFGVTVTVTSSLQIRAWKGDSNERVFANGVDISSHFNTQSGGGLSTQDVTSTVGSTPFTLTSVGSENQNNRAGAIAKIIVDGTTLINGYASDADSLIDTPTNYEASSGNNGGNYATFNPLNHNTHSAYYTLSNGNLKCVAVGGSSKSSGSRGFCVSTLGMSSGKYYFELTVDLDDNNDHAVGIATAAGTGYYSTAGNWTYAASGNKFANSGSGASYGASYGDGDTIGVAFNADTGALVFYKNGTSQGTLATVTVGETYFFVWGTDAGTAQDYEVTANFGARSFAYTPPTGHVSLCTQNLPDPTIADGSTAMDATLYTGTKPNSQTITGINHSPDFVWIKNRQTAYQHMLFDAVRGATKILYSSLTNAEAADSNTLTAFTSDGFTLGGNDAGTNNTNEPLVAWTWDAGTSTVSNTDGSITSSVRANASAGISIVGFTGNGSAATIGHGLNAAPELILLKNRQTTQLWYTYHKPLGANKYLYLNQTDAAQSDPGMWNNVEPTSSVFTVGSYALSNNYIAYCFAPVAGFSAFGSYEGNGNADGPFVYTGFRPRWVLFKSASGSFAWHLYDTARDTFNLCDARLRPDSSAVEDADNEIDILSNGFMPRTSGNGSNQSGSTFIYAAFSDKAFSLNGGLAR